MDRKRIQLASPQNGSVDCVEIALCYAPSRTVSELCEPAPSTGYARVAFNDWIETDNGLANASEITFPRCVIGWGTTPWFANLFQKTVFSCGRLRYTEDSVVHAGARLVFAVGTLQMDCPRFLRR